jgi:shikimate kinase
MKRLPDVLFVIGPSGVGKSDLCRALQAADSAVVHADLDDFENAACQRLKAAGIPPGGWNERWSRQLAEIECLSERYPDVRVVLADVGSGNLQFAPALEYLRSNAHRTLLVSAPFEVVLAHRPGRDPDDLRKHEFMPDRMAFYAKFPHVLEIGDATVPQLLHRFAAAVRAARAARGSHTD